MDSKEIKSLLKQAREAIREKEFKIALKHCKSVLKTDKNNYNAWVFIGVAAQEMEQPDQAIAAFTRGTEIAPDQLLAWQGLCNFYEKSGDSSYQKDLAEAYTRLVDLYSNDKSKQLETVAKLADLSKVIGNQEKYLEILQRYVEIAKGDNSLEFSVWSRVIKELNDESDLPFDKKKLLEKAYNETLNPEMNMSKEEYIQLYSSYLVYLYKIGEEEKAIQLSKKFHSNNPDSFVFLEFLCQLAVNKFVVDGIIIKGLADAASHLKEQKNNNSIKAFLVQGLVNLSTGNCTTAIQEITHGLKQNPRCPEGWLILSQAHMALYHYQETETIATKGLQEALKSNQSSVLVGKLYLSLAQALVGQRQWDSALKTLEKCTEKLGRSPPVIQTIFQALLRMGKLEKAMEASQELEKLLGKCSQVLQNEGHLLLLTKQYSEAEQKFIEAVNLEKAILPLHLLGVTFWETERYSHALSVFIKAIKLDPYFSRNYLYLGHYYKNLSCDLKRAQQCYQKAFALDIYDDESGMALSDTLRDLGDEESNIGVLKIITEQTVPGSCKWAWTRLGLCNIRCNAPDAAVVALQNALRIDASDSHCLECLGDAYLQRGSYTAAFKAFEMASELCPNDLYPMLQMATIKQTLGLYPEAVEGYKNVLQLESTYIPALKGLAEAQLLHAKNCLNQALYGLVVDCCEEILETLTRAVCQDPSLSCIWKLMGDTCTLAFHLDQHHHFPITVPQKLLVKENGNMYTSAKLGKLDLLILGGRLYGQALSLQPEVGGLWHDFGMNLYCQSQISSDTDFKQEKLEKSLLCLKKSVILDPSAHMSWNLLGVVAFSKGIEDCALAQHSFIKSILVESYNAEAWTNLGLLYFIKDNIQLAHETFKVAQALEPTFPLCWIGQAMIAEKVGYEDAMDLFRHTASLCVHPEALLGYSHWVCETLQDLTNRDTELYKYNIEQMQAVTVASDCIMKYTANCSTCAEAYNMLGLLLERQHLYQGALKAYYRAVHLLKQNNSCSDVENAVINYARLLSISGKQEASMQEFMSVKKIDMYVLCNFALSLYREGQLQQAQKAYQQALQLAKTEEEKSHILVGLAFVARKMQESDSPKLLLFKSSQMQPPSVQGLLALCALGLQNKDFKLSSAALKELLPYRHDNVFGPASAFLSACHFALQGKLKSARSHLVKSIHDHPASTVLWAHLSSFFLSWQPECASLALFCTKAAACHTADLTPVALLLSLAPLLAGCKRLSLNAAQKAIHSHPDKAAHWSALLAACYGAKIKKECTEKLLVIVKKIARVDRPIKYELISWLALMEILHYIQFQNISTAQSLLQSALKIFSSSEETVPFLRILDAICSMISSNEPQTNKLILAAKENPSFLLGWQILFRHCKQFGKLTDAEKILNHGLQVSGTTVNAKKKFPLLMELALLALKGMADPSENKEKWQKVCQSVIEKIKKEDPLNQAMWFIEALLALKTNNTSLSRRGLKRALISSNQDEPKYIEGLARKMLLKSYMEKQNEEALLALLEEFSADKELQNLYNSLRVKTPKIDPFDMV